MALSIPVPLLSGLSKMEQAKLLADLEELAFSPGETIVTADTAADWVLFVLEGEAEVFAGDAARNVVVMTLGPGDVVAEQLLPRTGQSLVRAGQSGPVRLYRMAAQRFERLLHSDPAITRDFIAALTAQSANMVSELSRTKTILAAYVDEVWNTIPDPQPVEAAAAMAAPPASEPAAERPQTGKWKSLRAVAMRPLGMTVGLALAGLVMALYHSASRLATATAILVWAAWNWLAGTLPDYVTAMAAATAAVMSGAVTPAIAFSGFTSPSWFLLLGVLGIGAAVSRSGLLYRLALHMLRLFPPTYRGQTLALSVTGVLFTPLLPSANSRAAMVSPLVRELSDAMRFPHFGKGSAGLAMSSFLGFGQMYFMFLNTNTAMLAWSLLPEGVRNHVNWLTWLWYSLPLGLLTLAGCYAAIMYLFPPEPTPGISRETIQAQLKVLGPMTRIERITTSVMVLVLLGFVTEPFHHIDPAWLALTGFLVLIGLGALDKHGLRSMDWGFMLLVGALLGLSEITKATGLGAQLTLWIRPMVQALGQNPYLFLGAVALLTVIIRLAVPIQQAVLIVVIALLPVTMQIGYSPFLIALVVLAMSNSWVVPQQNTVYVTIHAGTDERCFTLSQVRPLAVLQALVGILAVIASVPFWRLLGLFPK